MQALVSSQSHLRMTSREIADLVDKRHDNVKRTIETLITQGVIKSPQIEEIPTATKSATVYVFAGEQGKRDSYVVVAQLSPEFTAKLVDRWQELEGQHQLPTDPTLRAAVLAVMEVDKLRIEQQAQAKRLEALESMMPKPTTHMTVLAFFASNGEFLSSVEANKLGRRCAASTRRCGLIINTVDDDRYGSVNAYPLSVLQSVYEDWSCEKVAA